MCVPSTPPDSVKWGRRDTIILEPAVPCVSSRILGEKKTAMPELGSYQITEPWPGSVTRPRRTRDCLCKHQAHGMPPIEHNIGRRTAMPAVRRGLGTDPSHGHVACLASAGGLPMTAPSPPTLTRFWGALTMRTSYSEALRAPKMVFTVGTLVAAICMAVFGSVPHRSETGGWEKSTGRIDGLAAAQV